MLGCRAEGGRGPARWLCAEVAPSGLKGAQLDRISGGLGDEQEALAVPHREPAVEAQVDLDALADIAAPARAGRQLEDRRASPHGVVVGHYAAVLETEHLLQAQTGWAWSPGCRGIGRRDTEASIVARQVARQDPLGGCPVGRAGEA